MLDKKTTRRQRMTPEQARTHAAGKRARVRELLASAMAELTRPEMWRAYLAGGASLVKPDGEPYSVRNQMLIWMQNPAASDVAGYLDWQARGRQVLKGETGLMIYGPVTRKREDDSDGSGEGDGREICGITVKAVFDITQTGPIDGKPFKPAPSPRWRSFDEIRAVVAEVAGDEAGPVLAAMDEAAGMVTA